MNGRRGLRSFPYDLKPPIDAVLNAVVDRRCGALADHCLGGTLGILAQCETGNSGVQTGNSGVHRLLLLKTTTPHTLLSAAQSIRDCVVSLCHWVVNAGCTFARLCDDATAFRFAAAAKGRCGWSIRHR